MSNNVNGLYIINNYNTISQNVCLKNCISHHNGYAGIYVSGKEIVNIHGNATAIHSNGKYGIDALYGAKILLHLSSHHNTIYNNGGQDRSTHGGGTITNVED